MNGERSDDVARRLLWSQLDPPPSRSGGFAPVVYRVAVALSVMLAIVAGLTSISAVHAARAARQEVCAAKLDAWKARNPSLVRGLPPHRDACAHLDRIVGER